MKKASLSFVVVAFATVLVSTESFAQRRPNRQPPGQPQGQPPVAVVVTPEPVVVAQPTHQPAVGVRVMDDQVLTQPLRTSLLPGQTLRLGQAMGLSPMDEAQLEVLSVSVLAQTHRGRAELTLQRLAQQITSSERVRPLLGQVNLTLPVGTLLQGLELISTNEVLIESVTLTVRRTHAPIPGPGLPHDVQVVPNQMITLQLQQQIIGRGEIPLRQLVRQQLGLSLNGAEIERIVIEGQPMGGRIASVQVELNNRMVTQLEYLTPGRRMKPIRMMTNEEVRGNLRLHVQGDAFIQQIHIRVGQVRGAGMGGQIPQQPQRILVRQEVSQVRPLALANILPHEQRLVSALSIEASTRFGQAQLTLLSMRGEVLGSIHVAQIPMRHSRIQLLRPANIQELSISSWTPVLIESIEVEFLADQYIVVR
jgi:hypothetical protein